MNMIPTIPITAAQPMLPLILPEMRTFEEWSRVGALLRTARHNVDFLIGDWLLTGSTEYGEKARDEAIAIFRSDVPRFGPIVETCRRFPEDRRHAGLTFGHHLAVMAVEDDGEAERLLAEAEAQRMTAAQLKATVRVTSDRQVTMLEDDDPEDAAMRRIVHAWNRSPRAARQAFLELAQESHMGVIEL